MTIERKIIITPTPDEIAEVFAKWNSDEQARFFSALGEIVLKWENSFCFQAQYITDSTHLMQSGRDVMEVIGDYARRQL